MSLSISISRLPTVLCCSAILATGCGAVHSVAVQAPDVINPVCMGTSVSVGAAAPARKIGDLSNRLSAETTTHSVGYATATRSKNVNVFQEQVMERVKGSHDRAVNDLTIDVTKLHVYAIFYVTDKLFVDINGNVVELQQ